MKTTRLRGVRTWGRFQADRGIDFNGFVLVDEDGTAGGNLLIDPMGIDDAERKALGEVGGVRWIVLSNADHLRAAVELKREFGARLVAPAAERGRFGEAAAHVDDWFSVQDDLPAEVATRLVACPVRGGKSPVEFAFHLPEQRALYFGDIVRSHDVGSLRLLPDAKLADRAQVVADLRPLAELDFDAVLLGDGDSILFRGREAYAELLAAL
jgi:glyoxylase-like metal-dependent hydrolase (beta-lactamase superfamily II)